MRFVTIDDIIVESKQLFRDIKAVAMDIDDFDVFMLLICAISALGEMNNYLERARDEIKGRDAP